MAWIGSGRIPSTERGAPAAGGDRRFGYQRIPAVVPPKSEDKRNVFC